MQAINSIPRTSASGVQGEIRTPIEKLGEVLGLKRSRSKWAKMLEALDMDYEFKRQKADAAYMAVSGYRAELGESEGRLGRLKAEPMQGVTAEERSAAVSEAEHEVERARSAYDSANQRSRIANRDMNTALNHLRRVQVLYKATDTFEPVKPKPIKGTVEEVIARVTADIATVKAALRPMDEVVAEALADLDRQASEATVRVSFGKRTTVNFPVTRVAAVGSSDEIPHAPDPRTWLARFHRDELEADIRAQVAKRYVKGELALSDKDKVKRIAELEAEQINAQRSRPAQGRREVVAQNDRHDRSANRRPHGSTHAAT